MPEGLDFWIFSCPITRPNGWNLLDNFDDLDSLIRAVGLRAARPELAEGSMHNRLSLSTRLRIKDH